MTEDPFIALKLLMARLAQEADKIGLTIQGADFHPEGNLVDVLFVLKPEALMDSKELDQIKSDLEFDFIIKNFDEASPEPKTKNEQAVSDLTEKAREQLDKWMRE